MSYATLAELKVWIAGGGDIDTVDDSALQVILDACTRVIDRKCGRSFVLEDEVTKYFYPTSQGSLDVIDLISITSLASDSHGDRTYTQTFTSTEYELLPYTDPSGRPATRYQQIRIWPNSSKTFGPGRLVKIVGDWGYLDTGNVVPADVKQACLLLASREWKRREMPTGSLAIPDIGTVERVPRTDPDVEMLLDPYMRTNSWVAV
jgi:hypothetical protein